MDVDWRMIIAVEEKRIAILFKDFRHHPSLPDCSASVDLWRPEALGERPDARVGAPLRRGLITGWSGELGFEDS
jgi:hypothetical protein